MNTTIRNLAAAAVSTGLLAPAAPALADDLAGQGPPIEICLTVSFEVLCANFVDEDGHPWAVIGDPEIYEGLEVGDQVLASGILCQINCPVFFCGSFEGIIIGATLSECPDLRGPVPGDFDGGGVGFSDLLQLLSAFGDCPPADDCPEDLNFDGSVNFSDLLILLSNWA